MCLYKTGVLQEADLCGTVCLVFCKYVRLMHLVQEQYVLKSSSFKGHWGIDDYYMLAYLFGASQLCGNLQDHQPSSIHEEITARQAESFIYFACIKFIKQQKKGLPFSESSPLLSDISSVPTWENITEGLFKLFIKEYLESFEMMRQLKYGSLVKF